MEHTDEEKRKKRVHLFKRTVLFCAAVCFLLVIAAGAYIGLKVSLLRQEMDEISVDLAQMTGQLQGQLPVAEAGGTKEELTEEESLRKWEEQWAGKVPDSQSGTDIRKVYLTFDDGPSVNTDEILDILKEYDVKATFFVVAEGKEPYEDAYRRIVEEGHTLGMHSYSHVYREVYASRESFIMDVNMLQDYLHQVTGRYPQVYRFPGGSTNRAGAANMEELEGYLAEIGVVWYDWNISAGDATGHLSREQIVRNCVSNLEHYDNAMILLHDAADKKTTVEALPEIIETILEMDNTVIVPVTAETESIRIGGE